MRLPSLKCIEAFESAAKHLNFTRASEELNLTSAAVSQRIAALEADLGFPLFERNGPRLRLTEAGELARPILLQSLSQMRSAIGSLQDITQNSLLTIKVSPSFAHKWLIPRLGRFHLRYPNIDLRVWSMTNRIALRGDELCLAVYYGIDPEQGLDANLRVDSMFEEQVFPVCSPQYAEANAPFDSVDALGRATLLHDDTMQPLVSFPDWRRWCDSFEIEDVDTNHGPRYMVSSMAMNAAIEGQGVCLGRSALASDDLATGRLIQPFSEVYPLTFQYLFVYPQILAEQQNFEVFREWLLEEAARFQDELQDEALTEKRQE